MLPRELHRKAGDAGLLGAGLPEAVGGGGGDGADAVVICEEMHYSGAPGGVFASLFTCGISVPHMIASGDARLIDSYVRPTLRGDVIGSLAITEPGGGSDVGHLTTRAVRDGDDYIINGAKTYITSGVRADYVVTAARTGGPGAAGVSLIVVDKDTPGFEVTRKLDKMGWRSSDTAELSYTDVRVPAANLIGEENTGFMQIAGAFVSERVGLAAQAYASAQRCLDLTVEWCRNRETFGKPLITRQSVQNTLAEMARRVDVARVYTRSLVERQLAGDDQSDHRGVLRQEHRRRSRVNGWPTRRCSCSAAWGTWPNPRWSGSIATCASSASAAVRPKSSPASRRKPLASSHDRAEVGHRSEVDGVLRSRRRDDRQARRTRHRTRQGAGRRR